jgi:hypothetical protein
VGPVTLAPDDPRTAGPGVRPALRTELRPWPAAEQVDQEARPPEVDAAGAPGRPDQARPWRPGPAYLAAGAAYLALSLLLWWQVWTGHPSNSATCGCGDPSLFTWFMEWPAYALAHGSSPFYSTLLFHPGGINLLSNTSVLAIGLPMAPVTWLFGPVASLNLALTLSPVFTGLATFWLLRRWVSWSPAAFAGGLLFAFSPFVLVSLPFAHLMTAALALIPLIVGCLDELLRVRRRRPIPVGVALGLLLTVQFFVSTEMLLITAGAVALALVFLVGHGLVTDRPGLAAAARESWKGLATGIGLALVLLAYPSWYALAGPAHLSSPIWPNIPVVGGFLPGNFVRPTAPPGRLLLTIGGYEGHPLPTAAYLGWGVVVVAVGGLLAFRRDRRLWLFGAVGLVCALLSLSERHHWEPWRAFNSVPVADNIIQQRFVAITFLAAAAMVAIVCDHVRRALADATVARGRPPARARTLGVVGGVALMAGALVPIAVAFAPDLPYQARPVKLPAWFAHRGEQLPPGRVLLAFPPPFSGIQSAMTWQAVNRLHWAQAGGGGPQGTPARAGAARPGFSVLMDLAFGFGQPAGTRAQDLAVRQALRRWGVTTVVIPLQPGLPALLRGHDPVYAATFMAGVLGVPPHYQDQAWVWPALHLQRGPAATSAGAVALCTARAERPGQGPMAGPDCLLGLPGAPR